MKIKLYGTAAAEGIPALFCKCDVCEHAQRVGGKEIRSRSQSLINDDLLIDFPGDTFMHKVYQGLQLEEIEHLLITHSHHDHFIPEDLMMRMVGYSGKIDNKLTVYGNASVKASFDRAQALEGYSDAKRLVYKEIIEYKPFKVLDYIITPLLADHATNEKCFIYIIEQNNKTILYGHDSGLFPKSVWEYFEKTKPFFDLVVLDSTHQMVPVESNHMSFEDNLYIKNAFKKLKYASDDTKFVLTHFSHNGKLNHEETEKWAKDNGFIAAYDGVEISV